MALQKIADISICGEEYELAANGQACLVVREKEDAYGNKIASVVNLEVWLGECEFTDTCMRVQALMDLLVSAYRALQSNRDARLGAGKD